MPRHCYDSFGLTLQVCSDIPNWSKIDAIRVELCWSLM